MENHGEIILYQPEEAVKLEVRIEGETVWLNRQQMSELFGRDVKTIGKHINNALNEELSEMTTVKESSTAQNPTVANFATVQQNRVVAKFATTAADGKVYQTEYYSLDVILSVGYRVKSKRGVEFRRWASTVLKEYLLRGHAIQQRVEQLERTVAKHGEKIDFFIRTSLPPVEGIFFDGQIFDAYAFVADLIKSAKKSLVVIDNYVDESVLLMLCKRSAGVAAKIHTEQISPQLKLDLAKHNRQYAPVEIRTSRQVHDRFLIIDEKEVYHIGASLKDLGRKLFAFSKMDIPATAILNIL
jgi:hypothetical protein